MATPVASSLFVFLSLLSTLAAATDLLVGGAASAWTTSPQLLNRWAESKRFQVGDSLVWKEGSVLEVSREGYVACNRSRPLEELAGGGTVKLARSGPHYFIAGEEGACEKGVKLVVVVMAERSRRAAPASPPAEAPVPMLAAAPFSAAPVSFTVFALVFFAALSLRL
ncbi:early nodulin-like protein 13 [Wolffia australiana]